MDIEIQDRVNPHDSFRVVLKLLTIAGFCESQSNNKYVRGFHSVYRVLVLIVIVIFCVAHFIHIFMTLNDEASVTYGLVIAIPQFNLIIKAGIMYIHTSRIRRLHQLIQDPIFSATSNKDVEYIQKNNTAMNKMNKAAIYSIIGGGLFWVMSMIADRLEDPENASVPGYMAFDTSSTLGYALSVCCEAGPILWIGFGHFGADCVIATYYSQATTQLKILKYNLEHIFDNDSANDENLNSMEHDRPMQSFQYIDEANENIRKTFIYYVERYNQVAWFIKETSSAFDTSMSVQFFSTSVTTCLAVYNLSMMNIFSAMFFHTFFLLILFKMQVFFYCYFGHLVEHESQSINTAVYFSEWMSVSPRFRRYILIAMARWGQPLTPRVSTIVPVSLLTFASIVKLSYRLYTVMKTSHL